MLRNHKAQSRLPLGAMVAVGIIIVLVLFLIAQVNVDLKEKDFEIFIIAFAIAGLAFVWVNMRKDKLIMEGV